MSEETEPFTKPQREAIEKAWDILCEHFERVLVVVDTDVEERDGKPEDAHEGYWHGGSMAAIGMADFAREIILSSGRRHCEPE